MMSHLQLLIFISIITVCVKCQLDVPIVQTTFGAVRGVYEEDPYGQYFMYLGIPYGQAPPGNPFGDPINASPWEGILETNDSSVRCPQIRAAGGVVVGVEGLLDCLLLHVYVPANRTSSEPMPVLFWIFGGAFVLGSYNRDLWSPEFLVSRDIVHVAVNYRVGPFGYLCVGNEEIPGNAGYKDIVKGLRWVRDNVAAFGGDPNEVTVGGCSSGSIAVEFLIASPMTAGLFNKAIMQSGSANLPSLTVAEDHSKNVVDMAYYLGYRGGSLFGSLKFLKAQDVYSILYASRNENINYVVCLENEIEGVEPFLTENSVKIFETGNYTAVNVLQGFTSREIPFTIFDILDESYSYVFDGAVSGLNFLNDGEKEAVTDLVRSLYIGSQPITNECKRELEDLQSDYTFTYPCYRSANTHKKHNVSVYLYKYEYSGGRDLSKIDNNYDVSEPAHADDLGYLFKLSHFPEDPSENDRLMIDRMSTMWTNFVKYGDPTPEVSDLLPVKWLPVEYGGPNYFMTINLGMALATDPNRERFSFMDLLYQAYLSYDLTEAEKVQLTQRKKMLDKMLKPGFDWA